MSSTDGTTTQTPKTRKSRASRAADRAQADQQPKATVTPITAAGRSATGDNGGGRANPPAPAKAEAKTVKLSRTPKVITATAGVQTFDRHRGLAVKGDEQQQATGPNGAITSESAMKSAEKLARKLGEGWTAKVETFPRFMATVTPLEPKDAQPIVCSCSFGHRDEDAAHSCSVRSAHAHSLSI